MRTRSVSSTAALILLLATPITAQVGTNQGLANPNIASESALAALPGISGELAREIIDGRPWLDMLRLDGLLAQRGMSGEARTELYRRMWVPLDLNTASEEEILLIPGVGDRMAHEFDEYRPYVALAQWRREMGKYVDDAEVARMESYVFVPIDLNTASDEAILSIPGVGDRMLHEFKEYRPYSAMAQFRREMGKYVDDGEVERLARYVTIR